MVRNFLIVLLISISSTSSAAEVTGVARVIDGDTVQVANTRIRLQGMDAPETEQVCLNEQGERWACGISARDELIRHTGAGPWTCRGTAKDRFGRLIVTCEVNGENVQKWMVRNGWALSFVRYSHVYDAESCLLCRSMAWSVHCAVGLAQSEQADDDSQCDGNPG